MSIDPNPTNPRISYTYAQSARLGGGRGRGYSRYEEWTGTILMPPSTTTLRRPYAEPTRWASPTTQLLHLVRNWPRGAPPPARLRIPPEWSSSTTAIFPSSKLPAATKAPARYDDLVTSKPASLACAPRSSNSPTASSAPGTASRFSSPRPNRPRLNRSQHAEMPAAEPYLSAIRATLEIDDASTTSAGL